MANGLATRTRFVALHTGLALVVALLLTVMANARGEGCTSEPYSKDETWNSTILKLKAGTLALGDACSQRRTKVGGFIDGVPTNCQRDGDLEDEGACYASRLAGNVYVYPTGTDRRCDKWDGISNHRYSDGSADVTVEDRRVTPLFGQACEEEPPPDEGEEDCMVDNSCPDEVGGGQDPDSASPIIIATAKNAAYILTSAADGVQFDINGDGGLDRISWTSPNSDISFLAIDRNNNGQIDNGKELFGNFTYPGVTNGFRALDKMNMETNGGRIKGSVDGEDPLFAKLLLWNDGNHNGISESYELSPASSVLASIGVGYQPLERRDGHGNRFRFRGWAHIRTAPGLNKSKSEEDNNARIRHIWDVFFQYHK